MATNATVALDGYIHGEGNSLASLSPIQQGEIPSMVKVLVQVSTHFAGNQTIEE